MRIIATIALIITFIPISIISAQVYKPLVGIPGVNANTDFNTYISTLYALSISIAGLLAVIKIIVAGVKYMLTDVVTSKGEAKRDIQGALIGLLVVLSAVLILTVINKDITNVDLSLSPAINRQASNNAAPSVTTPAPEVDNAAYGAINMDNYSGEEIQAFIANCLNADNKYVQNSQNDGLARCYKTGAGRIVWRDKFCENMFVGCGQEEADARTNCVSNLGGNYTVDPEDTDYGICIY